MKSKIFFVSVLLIFAALYFFLKNPLPQPFNVNLSDLKETLPRAVEEIKKEVSSPPPLRAVKEVLTPTVLTESGVVNWTNVERKNNGLPALQSNAKLHEAAAAKVKDMFANQYFAHKSPSGLEAGDLVSMASYEFLAVGENLALGNFEDDKDLVEAWMNSPGHRANILDKKFQEIGVAVGKGVFEGKQTWLAVQEFALPVSACPQPDENLKLTIESSELKIEELSRVADTLRAEIEKEEPQTKKEYEEHNRKADEYNGLVKSINSLIEEVKGFVAQYNSQVRVLNECASG